MTKEKSDDMLQPENVTDQREILNGDVSQRERKIKNEAEK
jgi:hypothetical protein